MQKHASFGDGQHLVPPLASRTGEVRFKEAVELVELGIRE
jgi:hypothetical protein